VDVIVTVYNPMTRAAKEITRTVPIVMASSTAPVEEGLIHRESARYAKIVEWSEEDQCYVGSSPGLIYGGCHGTDENAVFAKLCQIVEKAIALYRADGKPLPPRTSGRDFANKMQNIA
jgi:predicted RNase H-like HicB family nuclease